MPSTCESFSSEVASKLNFYVYRLIDPRNGETFYVGKGRGDRVFAHVRAEGNLEGDDLDNKTKRIREIRNAGFEVAHVIHRHGMDDATALEVEAALIDAYPEVTNLVGGRDSGERGVMHAKEIIEHYEAKEAVFQHKVVLISINRSALDRDPYEAVRYAWKIDPRKAARAEFVLAVRKGLIIGVFVADRWLAATPENFAGTVAERPGRWGFVGHNAPDGAAKLYMRCRVPDAMRKPGAANPVRYVL